MRGVMAEEDDGAGVLVLTPQMRGEDGPGWGAPPPPASDDEEPPFVLTERVDGGGPAPAPAFPPAFGGAPEPVDPTPAEAVQPAPEAPQWVPAPTPAEAETAADLAPGTEPGSDPAPPAPEAPQWAPEPVAEKTEAPAWAPSPAPEPEETSVTPGFRQAPAFPGAASGTEPAAEQSPPAPEPAPDAPVWDPEPSAPAPSSGFAAAEAPGEGALRPAAADPEVERERPKVSPREVREAFSGATPGPLAATGLPRNGEELQAMIRQAIRDELAGPLGERISTNIRALVEREVARALAERERDGGS
ncbi:hypothetical protein P2H44_09495 [Albimonas sp. CAU 1670]|uniref:hypothetical protein n=1 Tax=Albimonas sp. CAU 1670 TaxID=3032599 RepID=UPI0023DBC345|nr:hypothetical protein [Albimonas sp. CAU 1670]MDF2232786.1 hypothetical protein [Albimonas sp. CAU 1670]